MRRSLGLSLIAFGFSLLSACGGGGGGGGGNNATPSSAENGSAINTQPATITRINGKSLTQAALTPAIFSDQALDSIAYDFEYFYSIASGQSGNSLAVLENGPCPDGGSYQLLGTVSATGVSGDVTITYNNCVVNYSSYGGYTRNGSIEEKLQAIDGAGAPIRFEYIYRGYRTDSTFQNTIMSSGLVDGSINMQEDNKIVALLTLKDLQSGVSVSTNNFTSIYTSTSYPYVAQRSGRVIYSTLGAVNVSSDAANLSTTFITGANQTKIRAVASSSSYDYYDLSLDENGDGNYDRFTSGFASAFDERYANNSAPIVNVDYSTIHPSVEEAVTIPLNNIYDNENDFLNYSARVLQSPHNADINLTLTENKTLSFHTHRAGDYAIELTVSDGNGGVTKQIISMHIYQPEPLVAPIYNSNISVGDNIAINLQPSNSEAGPFTYAIASGPAGMTIDNQGSLHWQVGSAFFPQTEVQAKINISNDEHSIVVPMSFNLSDPSKETPLVRAGVQLPGWVKNIFMGNFDGSNEKSILLTDREHLIYSLKLHNNTYSLDWIYPELLNDGNEIDHILPIDVDHDGKYEIAVRSTGKISLINSAHNKVIRTIELGGSTHDGLAAADIDGDGNIELIVLLDHRGIVLDAATLTEKWRTPYMPYKTLPMVVIGSGDVVVGNVDNDPALELVFSFGYVYDGGTHQLEWSPATDFGQILAVGDINDDGIDEIFGSMRLDIGDAWAYSALTQSSLWQIPSSPRDIIVSQLDNDNAKEILVNYLNGTTTAFDATLASINQKWSISGGEQLAVNIGEDNSTDVAMTAPPFGELMVFNSLSQTIKYSANDSLYFDGPYKGGLTLDDQNTTQLIFSAHQTKNNSHSHLIGIDPASGSMKKSQPLDNNYYTPINLCIADINGDNHSEVLLHSDDMSNGYVGAYNFSNDSWIRKNSTSLLAPHRAITCADFNNDGDIDAAVMGNNGIEVKDLFNQTTIWSSPSLSTAQLIASADLDNDGYPEIIYQSDSTHLITLKRSGASYIQQTNYMFTPTPPDCSLPWGCPNWPWPFAIAAIQIMDIDGDAKPEIVLAATQGLDSLDSSSSAINSYLITLNSDMTERSRVTLPVAITAIAPKMTQPNSALVAIADPDNSAYSTTNPIIKYRVETIDLSNGNWIWRSPLIIDPINQNSLHYDNANHHITFGTTSAMYITR